MQIRMLRILVRVFLIEEEYRIILRMLRMEAVGFEGSNGVEVWPVATKYLRRNVQFQAKGNG